MTSGQAPWLLTALSGAVTGKTFAVDRDGLRLGRTPDNDLVVPEANISRHHASFFFREGTLWVRDLGSKNGTFVNEARVTESPLHPEDTLRLAEFRFRVAREAPDRAAPEEPLPEVRESPAAGRRSNRRFLLYVVGGIVLVLAFGAEYAGKIPSLFGGRLKTSSKDPSPVPTSSLRHLAATDEEVTSWKVKADAAVGFNDMAAAVSLLRKVVAARPEDARSRALLRRCEARLRELIAVYDANGAREFEKLYFDRAIREWRKVLAISQQFDPEAYRKAEKRIREAEGELARKP